MCAFFHPFLSTGGHRRQRSISAGGHEALYLRHRLSGPRNAHHERLQLLRGFPPMGGRHRDAREAAAHLRGLDALGPKGEGHVRGSRGGLLRSQAPENTGPDENRRALRRVTKQVSFDRQLVKIGALGAISNIPISQGAQS